MDKHIDWHQAMADWLEKKRKEELEERRRRGPVDPTKVLLLWDYPPHLPRQDQAQ